MLSGFKNNPDVPGIFAPIHPWTNGVEKSANEDDKDNDDKDNDNFDDDNNDDNDDNDDVDEKQRKMTMAGWTDGQGEKETLTVKGISLINQSIN